METFKYRLEVMRKMWIYADGIKRFFLINIVLGSVLILLEFTVPILYSTFIEDVIIARQISIFAPIVLGYLGIHLAKTLFILWQTYNQNQMRNKLVFRVKNKIWNNLFHCDFSQYEDMNIGDMKMRLEDDVKVLEQLPDEQTTKYFISGITIIICIVLLFSIEWHLAIFSVICIPVTFWIDRILGKKEMRLNQEQRENDEAMNTWLFHSIRGWQEIKALNLQKHQKLTFIMYIKKYAMYYAKWINYWTLRVLIIPKLRNEFFMQFGLYFIGGLLIIQGNMRIGSLLVFAMYFNILSENVSNVSATDAQLLGQKPYYERLFEELGKCIPGSAIEPEEECNDKEKITDITFSHVSFSYPNTMKNVIKDFNMKIKSGDRIALVGESGCGKTTVLKLVTGMVEPTEGHVKINGRNLEEIELAGLHQKIGYIMQENCLFNDTIIKNLQLGKADAGPNDIEEACKKAGLYEEIMNMPEGFQTVIGERGKKLSGGQRQRLIMARTLLRDVDLYLFDEATSALDDENERKIYEAINQIEKDKIVIVVTHREVDENFSNYKMSH